MGLLWQSASSQKGQALLIIVLVIVVALTIALSLASRTVTQLRNTTDEANSQKAFSAAEAGVEQAIKTGTNIVSPKDLGNNSQINQVTVADISGDQVLLSNGDPIFQDDGTDIWLSPHQDDPTQLFQTTWGQGVPQVLTIDWGVDNSNICGDAAIELLVISGSRVSPTISKYAFDYCDIRRTTIDHFTQPAKGSFTVNGVNGSQTFVYQAQVTITDGLLARVIPLYKSASIGIKGTGLPIQGKIITSVGTAGSSTQQVVRKVTFFQGFNSLPSELFYSLFTAK